MRYKVGDKVIVSGGRCIGRFVGVPGVITKINKGMFTVITVSRGGDRFNSGKVRFTRECYIVQKQQLRARDEIKNEKLYFESEYLEGHQSEEVEASYYSEEDEENDNEDEEIEEVFYQEGLDG